MVYRVSPDNIVVGLFVILLVSLPVIVIIYGLSMINYTIELFMYGYYSLVAILAVIVLFLFADMVGYVVNMWLNHAGKRMRQKQRNQAQN